MNKSRNRSPSRWVRTWRQTWTSLHLRTTWPEYLLSIGLLLGLGILGRWLPQSLHLASVVDIASHPHRAAPRPWAWLVGLGLVGIIAIPWLTGRFYSSVVYAFTADTVAIPWTWPWHDGMRHRQYWMDGATWIVGFFGYWLVWVAVIIAAAVFTGRVGAVVSLVLWALSVPWLITWTGAIFVDHRHGWALWRTSLTREAWRFRWGAVWMTIRISVVVLGGIARLMHPTTSLGIIVTALLLLIVEYLLERFFNAWYLATYWICFRTDTATTPGGSKGLEL